MKEAAQSWYKNVYSPIVQAIREEHLLASFPGSTEGDMYLWIVKRWDELKREKDKNLPIKEAVKALEKESNGLLSRLKRYVLYIISKIKKN